MEKQERINLAIRSVVIDLMDRVMNKVTVTDPFIKQDHRSAKPLYSALVPDEIFKGSHFERRFVTPFGGVWEKLAVVVAREFHGHCEMGHRISGTVGRESLRRIHEVLARLNHPGKGTSRTKPDWAAEMEYIRAGGGELMPTDVVCDIYIESKVTGLRYAFLVNETEPDYLRTRSLKKRIMYLMAIYPDAVDRAYLAMPYQGGLSNVAGDAAWNFGIEPFTLMAEEFWDMIGGKGTYVNLIREVDLHGKGYRERIRTEFLGMAIPG